MAGIYVHIPYCAQACHYCDFHFSTQFNSVETMIKAMVKEIEGRAENWKGHAIETIYFGGGTPSRISSDDLGQILQAIAANYDLQLTEQTIEVNPEDVDANRLHQWTELGFDRLSIGIQSLQDDVLRTLNRVHGARQAEYAVHLAHEAGFHRISIDLIYGIPGMTDEVWQQQLNTISEWPIDHLSCYGLTIEPKTVLGNWVKKGKYPTPEDGQFNRQFKRTMDHLERSGWDHYEISNWSKQGCNSEHNSAYWKGNDYIGFGPSAHSFQSGVRSWNVSNNHQYMEAIFQNGELFESEIISPQEAYNELIMTRIRTKQGVNRSDMTDDFRHHLDRAISGYVEAGAVQLVGEVYILNTEGKYIADRIASDCFWVD